MNTVIVIALIILLKVYTISIAVTVFGTLVDYHFNKDSYKFPLWAELLGCLIPVVNTIMMVGMIYDFSHNNFKPKCKHLLSFESLRMNPNAQQDVYYDHPDFRKRVVCDCVKCGESLYAHCGLDLLAQYPFKERGAITAEKDIT